MLNSFGMILTKMQTDFYCMGEALYCSFQIQHRKWGCLHRGDFIDAVADVGQSPLACAVLPHLGIHVPPAPSRIFAAGHMWVANQSCSWTQRGGDGCRRQRGSSTCPRWALGSSLLKPPRQHRNLLARHTAG